MSQLQPVRGKELSTEELQAPQAVATHARQDTAGGVAGSAAVAHDLDVKSGQAWEPDPQSSNVENEERSHSPITIGEALEATAITAGNKLVEMSDAAAIQAAEVRATGRTTITPGGLAATAQSAVQSNAKTNNPDEKITLADILTDASSKLAKDKPATRQDAEGIVSAELRNSPDICTHPTGVAASVVAAARLNQQSTKPNND